MPTFRNISTIGFLLVTNDLKYDVSQPAVQYVPHYDHSAVSINLLFGTQRSGLGIWRCNPYLVCGVLCLWRTHWKHIFDGTTFWPNEAAARATVVLRRIHQCTSKGGT
ncbi:hypothetical protein G6F37_007373 [Rhizopus arrhizus]|nr:hypothetical protein G6F38_006410 [Rhizopus arrhizus]KAG1156697.1 hypothetical protein G6F37_007373 [Rhizopus arrhizus]